MEKGHLAGTWRYEAGVPQASVMDGDPTWHSEGVNDTSLQGAGGTFTMCPSPRNIQRVSA